MKEKQKLGKMNAPWDAAQVPSSDADGLNRSERVASVSISVKTFPNIADEQETQEQVEHSILVFVLNKNGDPLMPCTVSKARKLLKADKAKVVENIPFTIQLIYGSSGYKQAVTLGIDAGYTHIGYSAITAKMELIAGDVELRNDMKRLLKKRAAFRRTRRSRIWYREPRWSNRAKKEGWLAPSIKHKFKSHIKLIDHIKGLLPITEVIVEVAAFDTQKMQKPEVSGIEYQQGTLQGFNVRNYLLEKWHRKCSYCGAKNIPLEIEHIIPKSRGGSNRISNLCIACHECNIKKGKQTAEEFGFPKIYSQARKPLRAATFMNVIRWKLVNHFNCLHTYGYITKYWRIHEELDKTHINDAFIIAGGKQTTKRADAHIVEKQVRRQNRSLYKANILKGGKLKRNTVKEVNGYRRFDKVMFENREVFVSALRTRGGFALKTIKGEKVSDSVSSKKLKFIERAKGVMREMRRAIPLRTEVQSLLARA